MRAYVNTLVEFYLKNCSFFISLENTLCIISQKVLLFNQTNVLLTNCEKPFHKVEIVLLCIY